VKFAVTSLTSENSSFLNDDENKPKSHEINKDKPDRRFFINWGIKLNVNEPAIDKLIDWIIEARETKLYRKSITKYRHLAKVILLNLGVSLIQRRWLQIPRGSKNYAKGTDPHTIGFSKRHVDDILSLLIAGGYIFEAKGASYENDPQYSSYQATERFGTSIALATFAAQTPLKKPYVRVNKPFKKERTTEENIVFKQDEKDLIRINNFLKQHSFPLKGPMTRVYSKAVGYSGRIYCDFQNLSRRRVPIRQSSFIDGEPIAEVDIVASHPRMAVQEFYGEMIASSFYSDISDELDIFREKVKIFFRNALSSYSSQDAEGASKKDGIDRKDFQTLEKWLSEHYPQLPLYKGWSQKAMNHEGSIVKNVMLRGVDEGIAVLPIHDAVAVRRSDAQWASRVMKEEWKKHFGYDYCEVDIK
jgi:hypothetical protein